MNKGKNREYSNRNCATEMPHHNEVDEYDMNKMKD